MDEERDTNKKKNKKKTRGKPKLVPRFAAGTSNKIKQNKKYSSLRYSNKTTVTVLVKHDNTNYEIIWTVRVFDCCLCVFRSAMKHENDVYTQYGWL